ncbi:MAG TPA: phosphoenolpyruvate-utilizing N-terminal domain-containing protein, partial [Candidatus Krumholzibacterium sp.]|nr:phosphoenolpyruvate-utilizing N-terminal domain-containing protein [Candidatus Krumholzibacterium sp.]
MSDMARSPKKEIIFNGIPAAPGIAFGRAFVVNIEDLPVSSESIDISQIETEIARFEDALKETETELNNLKRTLASEMGEEHAKILDSHLMMAADELMKKETIEEIQSHKVDAACAFTRVIGKTLRTFDQMEDQYLRERAEDIRDLKRRVIRNLFGQKSEGIASL